MIGMPFLLQRYPQHNSFVLFFLQTILKSPKPPHSKHFTLRGGEQEGAKWFLPYLKHTIFDLTPFLYCLKFPVSFDENVFLARFENDCPIFLRFFLSTFFLLFAPVPIKSTVITALVVLQLMNTLVCFFHRTSGLNPSSDRLFPKVWLESVDILSQKRIDFAVPFLNNCQICNTKRQFL